MKTKTSIFKAKTKPQKTLKPIEFKYFLNGLSEIEEANLEPRDFGSVTLLVRDYSECKNEGDFDLILGYDNDDPSKDPNSSCLFLGKWNDGVVE